MLRTILESEPLGKDKVSVVVREQVNKPLTDRKRFMTHLWDVSTGHTSGHYDMMMDEAFGDFLDRVKKYS